MNKITRVLWTIAIGGVAAVSFAQVDPVPRCVSQSTVDGGACSKWTDITNPETCPDEVIRTDGCTDTTHATSGYSTRTGYDATCEMRVRVWNPVTQSCVPQVVPAATFRCYEASGTPCGPGCGTC